MFHQGAIYILETKVKNHFGQIYLSRCIIHKVTTIRRSALKTRQEETRSEICLRTETAGPFHVLQFLCAHGWTLITLPYQNIMWNFMTLNSYLFNHIYGICCSISLGILLFVLFLLLARSLVFPSQNNSTHNARVKTSPQNNRRRYFHLFNDRLLLLHFPVNLLVYFYAVWILFGVISCANSTMRTSERDRTRKKNVLYRFPCYGIVSIFHIYVKW